MDEGAGAGAWTCARATAWNSQHWVREGAWQIEGVSHRPSAQQRARKFVADSHGNRRFCRSMNDSPQLHARSRVATRPPRRGSIASSAQNGRYDFRLPRQAGSPAVSVISSKMAGVSCTRIPSRTSRVKNDRAKILAIITTGDWQLVSEKCAPSSK